MTQQEINEEILHILTCLIHSDDHYKRECVDLNANAFLSRLKDMIHPRPISHIRDEVDENRLRKWTNWVYQTCINCGKRCKIQEDKYGYRYSYVNDAGHNDYDFYCKECGKN